ncbi:MAG: hypothetical protein GC152_13310 [Alphaproteobacteria bacterium]|nr:hypothetical protein [Alphaproteobacteria bacterium]
MALKAYREGVSGDIERALKDYFDPTSGRFSERVERLVRKDGELEAVMQAQVSGNGSALMRTLGLHLGPESPIMKLMDPSAEKGLAQQLAASVEATAKSQRDQILREFSLDNPESALARTIRELGEAHGEAGRSLEKKVAEAVAEFSLDKEDSALSRLVRRVDAAQRMMSEELSLDKDGSALARIRLEMLARIEGLSKRNDEFQKEVIARLTEMTVRRSEALRSTSHGNDFEAALFAELQDLSQKAGDLAGATGGEVGMIKNCKVGDCVIELGPDSAVAGARIVVEAKQSASVTLGRAREEIEIARKNRGADVGLFVFSKRSAPQGLDPFTRLGDDVFVIWDQEDATSDIYLRAGLSVAKALIVHGARDRTENAADIEDMERAVRAVEKSLKGLGEIDGLAKNVLRDSGKIENRVRIMTAELDRELARVDQGLRELRSGA